MGLAADLGELFDTLHNTTAVRYNVRPNLAAGVTLTSGGAWALGASGLCLAAPGAAWYAAGVFAHTASIAEQHVIALLTAATVLVQMPFDAAMFSEGQTQMLPYIVQGVNAEAVNAQSASVTGGGTVLVKAVVATGI